MANLPLPPPLGLPRGPSCTTAELLSRFLSGAGDGIAPDAHVEGVVLLAADGPLAIRLDGATLVRDQVPERLAVVWEELRGALSEIGMRVVERDPPLALIVEAEVFGRRCYAWDLWAADEEQGRAALAARAVGDMPGILEAHEMRQHDEARIDAVLSELEFDL